MLPQWIPDYATRHSLFKSIESLALPSWADWPSPEDLTTEFLRRHPHASPILFLDQEQLPADGCYYEARVARDGVVPTRTRNWHDFFNALIWLHFPLTKRALNQLHVREIARLSTKRSPARDAATLFDESGLIIVAPNQQLQELLTQRHWSRLFQECQHQWGKEWQVWVFGHAILEKGINPHIGITAKCWVLLQPANWEQMNPSEKTEWVDQQLAQALNQGVLQQPSQLPVMPILGIPGWWPVQDADFYGNPQHFCPPRAR